MKPSFRVHIVVHEDGRRSGMLLRTWDGLFDRPPPSAYGETTDDILEELEAKLEALLLEAPKEVERYLWSEELRTQRIRVDIHPLSSVKKRPVIGKKEIPLVLTYAYCTLKGGGYRVMLPRFGASFIVEELSLAADVLRHAVSTALVGENARWVYDFRDVGEEHVRDWSPPLLARLRAGGPPKSETLAPPELARVADELVDRAARGKLAPVIGDSAVFDAIATWTLGETPPSILLVGPPGVGKSALVRRLAKNHVAARKDGQKALRIFSTSRDRIVAGMIYLGMWQERCLTLVRELAEEGDYLHVDSLGGLLEAQPDGASIADFFEPALDELRILAECTQEELERARRARPSFVQRFTVVRLEEPTAAETMVLGLGYARKKNGLDLHPTGMKRLVRHLGALERGTAFPGKALRFIDWLAVEGAKATYPRDVSAAYARYSGVPLSLLSDDIAASAGDLASELKKRVIGQDAACDACGRVLARFKANLVDPERPCGTLLFVGPTGVGKTELAKELARSTFGGEDRMIRFDMSEFMLPGSVSRLTSSASGTLASRVGSQPLSLVLFDEIEKAHADVFDLLLGILGEGRLTDDRGRFVDFRTTLIVMTSNIGVTDTRAVGFSGSTASGSDLDQKVRAHFRPELYNRIDHVLTFRALGLEDVARIVDLELRALTSRTGFARRNLRLVVTPAARLRLAELGYHPTRGARPLRRLIEERVVTPVAALLAEHTDVRDGLVSVVVDGEAGSGVVIRL